MKLIVVLFISSIFFTGCGPQMYAPTTPNISNFKKRYELHADLILSPSSGLNYNTALSPLNHICLQFNGSFINGNYSKQNYWETAIGFYNIMKPVISNQILFGYGKGNSEYNSTYYVNEPKGTFTKVFGQLNFNLNKNEKHLSFFCVRLADVMYTIVDMGTPKDNLGKTYEIYYAEFFYSYQVQCDRHTSVMFHLGLNHKSEPDQVIVTVPVTFGIGLNVKLFNIDN